MKTKNWTGKEKAQIVLEGNKGQLTVGELCAKYGVHQSQYYRWRDQFLENIPKVFEMKKISKGEARLSFENSKLKRIIGDLTVELKKNDEEFL